MCILCLEFQKGNLTKPEAKKALLEFINTEAIELEHTLEIADLIESTNNETTKQV